MKKLIHALTLAAVAVPIIPATVETAEARHHRDRYDKRYYYQDGRYREPRRISRNDYVWRGNNGRYYCKRDNGTTGLIIGAGAGALLGNVVDGGRNRTLGTILGAVGGGLAGREIDRSDSDVRCR